MCQNHNVFSAKVAQPTISRTRERPDPHQVRSLCIKVACRFVRDLRQDPRAPYQHRQNPFIASSVWGIYIYIYIWLFAKSPYRSRLPGGLVRNLVTKKNWRPCTGSTPKDLVRPPCTTTLYATLYACLHLAPNIWPYNFPSRRPQPVADPTAKSADGAPEVVFTLYEPCTNGTYKRFNRNYPHSPRRKDLQARIQICSMGFAGRNLILGSKTFLWGGPRRKDLQARIQKCSMGLLAPEPDFR